jgi:hypothetical protein
VRLLKSAKVLPIRLLRSASIACIPGEKKKGFSHAACNKAQKRGMSILPPLRITPTLWP